MATSDEACSHRWLVAVYQPHADPDPQMRRGVPLEVVATDSCAEAERIVRAIRTATPHLLVEAMATRFQHFTRWLEREELERAENDPHFYDQEQDGDQ